MIFALEDSKGYYHGGNVFPEYFGGHPFYATRFCDAKRYWTPWGARRLLQSTHRAHRGAFRMVSIFRVWRQGRDISFRHRMTRSG